MPNIHLRIQKLHLNYEMGDVCVCYKKLLVFHVVVSIKTLETCILGKVR